MTADTTDRLMLDELGHFHVGARVRPAATLHCPSCGGLDPEAVSDGFRTNFLCHYCGRCTHFGRADLWTLDPHTCHGCPHRSECLASVRPCPAARSRRRGWPGE